MEITLYAFGGIACSGYEYSQKPAPLFGKKPAFKVICSFPERRGIEIDPERDGVKCPESEWGDTSAYIVDGGNGHPVIRWIEWAPEWRAAGEAGKLECVVKEDGNMAVIFTDTGEEVDRPLIERELYPKMERREPVTGGLT